VGFCICQEFRGAAAIWSTHRRPETKAYCGQRELARNRVSLPVTGATCRDNAVTGNADFDKTGLPVTF
jgi:hypothetical protein